MSLGLVRPPHEVAAEGPLNILHVAERETLERLGPMFLDLARQLREREISSTFLTDAGLTALQLGFDASVVRDVRALTGWGSWWYARDIRAQLEGDFDVVHYWSVPCVASVVPIAKASNWAGIVYVSADSDLPSLSSVPRQLEFYPANGSYEKRLTKFVGAVRVGDVIRLAIEPPKLELTQTPEAHVPTIVWSGRMEEVVGLRLLAEAARMLKDEDIEFQVALLSLGGNAASAWQALRSREVDGQFSLVESVHMIPLGLAAADVFVVPAPEPAARLVPLEAIASGIQLVVSDAHRELWSLECNHIKRFEAGSAESLADALRSFLTKPTESESFAAGRQYVQEEYGVERALDAWEQAYRQTVAEHRAAVVTDEAP